MQVKEIMKQPYVVEEDMGLGDTASLMSEKGVGCLLFVSKGKVKGIISESDLLRNFGKSKMISQIMSKNIISASPDDNVEDALKVMKENKIKRLPIVDKQKRLVGIISMTDIAANIGKFDGDFFFN